MQAREAERLAEIRREELQRQQAANELDVLRKQREGIELQRQEVQQKLARYEHVFAFLVLFLSLSLSLSLFLSLSLSLSLSVTVFHLHNVLCNISLSFFLPQ